MRVTAFMGLLLLSFGQLYAGEGPDAWPLTKGTYWIYEGDVSWVEQNPATGQNQVYHKHLLWKSEVVDAVESQGAYLLRGFPTDLAWYKSTTQPADRLLLHVGTDYYETTNKAAEIFQRIKGPGYRATTEPKGDTNTANLLLSTPLALGKRLDSSDVIAALFTSRYCRVVESVTPFDPRTVRNAPELDHPQCYSITCHTNPDNDELDFVPGLGITSYSYLHHGTTMEVSVYLKEFGQPAAVGGPNAGKPVSRVYRSKT